MAFRMRKEKKPTSKGAVQISPQIEQPLWNVIGMQPSAFHPKNSANQQPVTKQVTQPVTKHVTQPVTRPVIQQPLAEQFKVGKETIIYDEVSGLWKIKSP